MSAEEKGFANLFFVTVLHMTVNGVAIATVISNGYIRLMMVMLSHFLSLIYEVMSGYLRGFGISLPPALLTIFGVCVIRIAWIQLVFPHSRTFRTIMTAYPVSLFVTMLLIFCALMYFRSSGISSIYR